MNLNGNWSFVVTRFEEGGGISALALASRLAGRTVKRGLIVVPFAVETSLSGVNWKLAANEVLSYNRSVNLQPDSDRRYLLRFESVDYHCVVSVNGQEVGSHTGGSTPFAFEVTRALTAGDNVIVVHVEDATGPFQMSGKQSPAPKGRGFGDIWYNQSSGIRGTVWLEEVPSVFIRDLKITSQLDDGSASQAPSQRPPPALNFEMDVSPETFGKITVRVAVLHGSREVVGQLCKPAACRLPVPGARLWTPDDPFLYDLRLELRLDGRVVDTVHSYTGIRTVGKRQDARGSWRFTLNGGFIFHWGTLDQGWWPRGGLTPDSDRAMVADVEFQKAAGFNMIRKHMKVEPRRFYYHCDRLGMLVWQDQVSAAGCAARRVPCDQVSSRVSPSWMSWIDLRLTSGRDAEWPEEAHQQYMAEFAEMINMLYNSPSVVVWTPFNEGWGQHRTVEVTKWVHQRDPSRLVNAASGGNFFPVGDIADWHHYPDPKFDLKSPLFKDYVRVVGEYGGFQQKVTGHTPDNAWGYDNGAEALLQRFQQALRQVVALARGGVAAAVYTQATDVEQETNGLLTYDRQVQKLSASQLRRALSDSGLLGIASRAAQGQSD